MQKLMYLAAMSCMFMGIQSGNFATFTLLFSMAYIFIEAADTM